MSIIPANRSWETQTAYQLAKAHLKSKAARNETPEVSNTEKTDEEAETAVKETLVQENEAADKDVFLPSTKDDEEETPYSLPSNVSSSQSAKDSGSFKMKSSAPDDSVGQLAAELARAETKLDVLQVSGKATRALANLRAASATAEGDDAKKIAAQIRRMEKLMKNINKKIKHLDKEEQLEIQRKKALEKEEKKKADQIDDELKSRRKKRRKDEKNYAAKEMAEDQKEANADMMASLPGTGVSAPSVDAVSGVNVSIDAAMGADISAAPVLDAGTLDISV